MARKFKDYFKERGSLGAGRGWAGYNGGMSEQTGARKKYWWKQAEPGGDKGRATNGRQYWWKAQAEPEAGEVCAIRPRPGHLCPECGEGTLAYNGLFVLTCPECDYVAESGANF